jgi:hypothetical protein
MLTKTPGSSADMEWCNGKKFKEPFRPGARPSSPRVPRREKGSRIAAVRAPGGANNFSKKAFAIIEHTAA